MGADGSDQAPLFSIRGTEYPPVWSPDGKRIASLSDRSGDFEIYRANIDGSDRQLLTFQAGWDYLPSWTQAPVQ